MGLELVKRVLSREDKSIRYLPIPCHFTLSAVNQAIYIGKDAQFGEVVWMEYDDKTLKWAWPEWWVKFERGRVISKGVEE